MPEQSVSQHVNRGLNTQVWAEKPNRQGLDDTLRRFWRKSMRRWLVCSDLSAASPHIDTGLLIPAQRAIANRQDGSGLSVSVRPQTSRYEQSELMGDDKFVASLRVSRAGLDASRRVQDSHLLPLRFTGLVETAKMDSRSSQIVVSWYIDSQIFWGRASTFCPLLSARITPHRVR